MNAVRIMLACFVLVLPVACSGPTLEEYQAAQTVLADPDATIDERIQARAIVDAFDAPIPWVNYAITIGGTLLGLPMLGTRGRALAGIAIDAMKSLDAKKLVKVAPAYVGMATSRPLLEAQAGKLKEKALKTENPVKRGRMLDKAAKLSPAP